MMRALLIISALVVLAVAGVGATSASAAGLTLTTAPQHYVGTESACALGMANGSPVIGSTSAAVGVAGSYSQVALSGIPNACAGLPLDVNVHGASGEVLATGVTTAGVGSATAAVGGVLRRQGRSGGRSHGRLAVPHLLDRAKHFCDELRECLEGGCT